MPAIAITAKIMVAARRPLDFLDVLSTVGAALDEVPTISLDTFSRSGSINTPCD